MPWNAKTGARRLGPGIPKSDFWASTKEGIDQVGCVYTAQGFEFDSVGVIFRPDLVYRPMDGGWIGQPKESHDCVVRRGRCRTSSDGTGPRVMLWMLARVEPSAMERLLLSNVRHEVDRHE